MSKRGVKHTLKWWKGRARKAVCPRCSKAECYPVTNYGHPTGEMACHECRFRWEYSSETKPPEDSMIQVKIVRDGCRAILRDDFINDRPEYFPLPNGTIGRYIGHVIGGNISMELDDGRKVVVDPRCTDCS